MSDHAPHPPDASAPAPAAPSIPAPPQAVLLPLGTIKPSATNPRTRFDKAALAELAASMAQHDVMTPVIVRPHPQATPDNGHPPYELVAGERRWRACGLLVAEGRPYHSNGHVLALVRQLTDREVLALQALENIQRQDLHPLEEAQHYWLMTNHPSEAATVAEVADMIGKSPAYVYNRIGLLRLVPAAREAFFEGKLDYSKAMMVAALPPQQQPEVVTHITTWGGEPMGARAAQRFIQDRFTLRLKDASFSPADSTLVPEVGPCTTCFRRSSSQAAMFDEPTDGDRCLDTLCWQGKREAHRARLLEAAKAAGRRVLQGDDASAVWASATPSTATLADGWHDLNDRVPARLGDATATVGQVMEADLTPAESIRALLHPVRDAVVHVVSTLQLRDALRRQGLDARPPAAKTAAAAAPERAAAAPASQAAGPASASKPAGNDEPPSAGGPLSDAALADMLNFAIVPAGGAVDGDALELFRQRAITRTARVLIAREVAAELRHRGEALRALLPANLHGLVLWRMAGNLLQWHSAAITPTQAALLAGTATLPPQWVATAEGDDAGATEAALDAAEDATATQHAAAMAAWVLGLSHIDATALAWVLLAITEDSAFPLPPAPLLATWRAATAKALGINPQPLEERATQLVDERLRIELLSHATIAKAAGRKGKAGGRRKPDADGQPGESTP